MFFVDDEEDDVVIRFDHGGIVGNQYLVIAHDGADGGARRQVNLADRLADHLGRAPVAVGHYLDGLGGATARALAASGAKVAILDLNEEATQAMASELGGIALPCDVTDPAAAEAAIARTRDEIGAPRIVVNCAGIGVAERIVGREGPMELGHFARVININLIGSFNIMRLAAAEMIKLDALDTAWSEFVAKLK